LLPLPISRCSYLLAESHSANLLPFLPSPWVKSLKSQLNMPLFPFKVQVTQSNPPPVNSSRKYHHGGIGGRGNYKKITKIEASAAPSTSSRTATPTYSHPSLSSQPQTFPSGRGGVGNRSITSESAIFHFDEELERLRRNQDMQAPVYHVGRGGAGNSHDERMRGRNGSIISTESEGDETGMGKKSLEWMRDRLGIGSSGS